MKIIKWIKENKFTIMVLVIAFLVMLYIGYIMYSEMATILEDNPDIKEFDGPPVVTDLRLVTVVVVGAGIFCGFILVDPLKIFKNH